MSTIHFPARTLTPFASPVAAGDLRRGEVYFCVQFIDDEMQIPVVQTLEFIGPTEEGSKGSLSFKTLSTTNPEEEGEVVSFCGDSLASVFEFESALDELMRCAMRRINT